MVDKSQWPHVDLGFKVFPPKQKRAAGRPRVQRIRSVLEGGTKKKIVKCKRCGGFQHFQKRCKLPEMWEEEEEEDTPRKRKRQQGEGPSQVGNKKKRTPKKKKTPQKKKNKKAASAPPARVVRDLKSWLNM